MTTQTTGAHAIVDALIGAGVDHIFSSPGSEWAPLWEVLAELRATGRPVPAFSSVRHEELAVSMATGYAKASGRLPAVVLHTTVGTLHATMALRTATHERVPMVGVAGGSVGYGELPGVHPGGQWLNHLADLGGPAALVERTVKWAVGEPQPDRLAATVARACDIARAEPRGPAFVAVSMESLFAPAILTRLVVHYLNRAPQRLVTPPAGLTAREIEVLTLVGRGLSNQEIAAELTISMGTVKTHIGNLLAKLHARDRAQLVIAAYESGLVTPGRGASHRE